MAKVILFGNGIVASVCYFYLTHDTPHEVVAFTVDKKYITDDTFFDLPVVPFEEITTLYPPDEYKMHISISFRGINKLREQKYLQAKDKGYELISYISSKAITWPGLVIGDNCFIHENTVIHPFSKIGSNVTIWSGVQIGHHTIIGDHCFIAIGASIAGVTTIESHCFIGANATIRDNITIASECVIGAGVVMLRSTKKSSVYVAQAPKLMPYSSERLEKMSNFTDV